MLNFLYKRLHLLGVSKGKEMFEKVPGMTPARFDFLYAIRVDGEWLYGDRTSVETRQSDIAKQLGLHPSTVSKMTKRLIEMEWIEKGTDRWDQRQIILRFTKKGLDAFLKAERILFKKRSWIRFWEFCFSSWCYNIPPRQQVCDHWQILNELASQLGDQSYLLHDYDYVHRDVEGLKPGWVERRRENERRRQARLKEYWKKRGYG